LTQEECALLQERADTLGQGEPVVDAQEWMTLAVVRLNEEYIGLDPLVVREFAELGHIVPIPCCPNFVLGHMNLRGEVLTVFDLRHVFNMPVVENLPFSQVAVIQFDSCLLGIAVQEVLDCVSCESKSGDSFRIEGEGGSFIKVVSQYQGKSLKYLDVSRLIESKVLEVYEEV
jgi:purine-binding chemotaxis protein CheW